MTLEMRRTLARLPYEEKLRMVAELIEFSRAFKQTKTVPPPSMPTLVRPPGGEDSAPSKHGQVLN